MKITITTNWHNGELLVRGPREDEVWVIPTRSIPEQAAIRAGTADVMDATERMGAVADGVRHMLEELRHDVTLEVLS